MNVNDRQYFYTSLELDPAASISGEMIALEVDAAVEELRQHMIEWAVGKAAENRPKVTRAA